MRRREKKRFFRNQVNSLVDDIERMLMPRVKFSLMEEKQLQGLVQRLVNKAYRHGFGRGLRDGIDNPRA
jgi:hypothetical protein